MDERNRTHKVLEKTSGTLVKLWYKSGVAINKKPQIAKNFLTLNLVNLMCSK